MANGTLAASQIEMLSQSGTGIMTIVPPATNTNRTLTLPDVTGTVSTLNMGTAVASTSGTSIDFTGIPAGVKKITINFVGVSSNGTSRKIVQLGDSGGFENTGYLGASTVAGSATPGGYAATDGFVMNFFAAADVAHGSMTINLVDSTANTWASNHTLGLTSAFAVFGGGSKSLSATLTQIRITTQNGTDAFDAGTINIMYEG
jgi:hypothetical protein